MDDNERRQRRQNWRRAVEAVIAFYSPLAASQD
jgi:hypothetical protein